MESLPIVDGVQVLLPPPPQGYKVDFASPNQQHHTAACVLYGIGLPISTFFFLQYAYVKLWLWRKVDAQLVCLVLGWVFSIAMQSIEICSFLARVVGVHLWEMPAASAQQAYYNIFGITILNSLMTGLCKTSLALFYCHLFPQTWWKRVSRAVLVFIIGYNAAIFISIITTCKPIENTHKPGLPQTCIHQPVLLVAKAGLDILSDLMLLVMPVPVIMRLALPTKQKLYLILSLGLGSITMISTAVRLYLLFPLFHSLDITWLASAPLLIILFESHVMIICATLTTIRPFVSQIIFIICGTGELVETRPSRGLTHIHSFMTPIRRKENAKRVNSFDILINQNFHANQVPNTDHASRDDCSPNAINNRHRHSIKARVFQMVAYRDGLFQETIEKPDRVHYSTRVSKSQDEHSASKWDIPTSTDESLLSKWRRSYLAGSFYSIGKMGVSADAIPPMPAGDCCQPKSDLEQSRTSVMSNASKADRKERRLGVYGLNILKQIHNPRKPEPQTLENDAFDTINSVRNKIKEIGMTFYNMSSDTFGMPRRDHHSGLYDVDGNDEIYSKETRNNTSQHNSIFIEDSTWLDGSSLGSYKEKDFF